MQEPSTSSPELQAETALQTSEASPILPRIKVVGVGASGLSMVEELDPSDIPGAARAAVMTEASQYNRCSLAEKVLLDHGHLRGVGAGGDPERARDLAREHYDELVALAAGFDVIILVVGLGGGAGTGITPVVSQAAKEAGALAVVFATLPFTCECRRVRVALEGLREARAAADGVVCLQNERILELIDNTTPCEDAFALTRRFVAHGVRGFYHWLVYRGPMAISFAEVCKLLQDQHTESAFLTVEAEGPDRGKIAVEKLLASPLLDKGKSLAEAQSVVISLLAGAGLPMAEVNQVIKDIGVHCGNAELLSGTALAESMSGRLAVTVLTIRQASAQDSVDSRLVGSGGSGGLTEPGPSLALPGKDRGRLFDVSDCPGEEPADPAVRARKRANKVRQAQLALPLVSRGHRFENSEPTMHKGEDLDIPTYIRRGIVLN